MEGVPGCERIHVLVLQSLDCSHSAVHEHLNLRLQLLLELAAENENSQLATPLPSMILSP